MLSRAGPLDPGMVAVAPDSGMVGVPLRLSQGSRRRPIVGTLRFMRISDFVAYREGDRWSRTLTSTTSTIFLADVTKRLDSDDLGSNGFGMEDVVAVFCRPDLEVTLFGSAQDSTWVSGALVTTADADFSSNEWRPLPSWDGSPFRFCLDSGVAVLAVGEAFEDIRQVRNGSSSLELAASVSGAKTPISDHDRVMFNTDAYCFDCWVLGEPGAYQALYVDLDVDS